MTLLRTQSSLEAKLDQSVLNLAQIVNAGWPELDAALCRAGSTELAHAIAAALHTWFESARALVADIRSNPRRRTAIA